MIRLSAIGLLTFVASLPMNAVGASWVAVNETDPFTDETLKAIVYEDADHRIQISVETETQLALYLTKKTGTFEPNTPLDLRVDTNPMVSYSDTKNSPLLEQVVGMPMYRWTPTSLIVNFGSISLLNPQAAADQTRARQSCRRPMTQFLNGETVIGRYYVNGTQREVFSVPLDGFNEAANEVFEIAPYINDNPFCER